MPLARAFSRQAGKLRPFFWRRLVFPYFAWRVRPFVCKTSRGFLVAGETGELIQNYIYFLGQWEPHVGACIDRRLKAGDLFVDVGANIGYFSLLALSLGADVVAIEASSAIYGKLDRNLGLSGAGGRARSIHGAVACQRGRVQFYVATGDNGGVGSLLRETGQSELVDAAPLGDWLTAGEIGRARLIKIDVEGAEVEVMTGIRELLPMLPNDVEFIVEVLPETFPAVSSILPGFHAYALPPDSMANYFEPTGSRVVRLTHPPAIRTDVLLSRVAAEWI
jgi:FkbM family methyltransferase